MKIDVDKFIEWLRGEEEGCNRMIIKSLLDICYARKPLHRIPYTGRILVGDEFLDDYYIHMGYQRSWAYKVLKEFVFEPRT